MKNVQYNEKKNQNSTLLDYSMTLDVYFKYIQIMIFRVPVKWEIYIELISYLNIEGIKT